MIPDSLKQLLKSTQGQQTAHWEGREVVLFNMPWGELVISLQGAQVLHFRPHDDSDWLGVWASPKASRCHREDENAALERLVS
jgi:glucose-6-phosphate 1-epimerase